MADWSVLEGVDELRFELKWKSHVDLGALRDKEVQLRFHLQDAHLYAFKVNP